MMPAMVSDRTTCAAIIRGLHDDEPSVQELGRALYERMDYGDAGLGPWEDLEEADREFYCSGAEAVLSAILERLNGPGTLP